MKTGCLSRKKIICYLSSPIQEIKSNSYLKSLNPTSTKQAKRDLSKAMVNKYELLSFYSYHSMKYAKGAIAMVAKTSR